MQRNVWWLPNSSGLEGWSSSKLKSPHTRTAEAPQEDPLTRIRRQAQELGLLKETTVS